jgi:hypothetical protein
MANDETNGGRAKFDLEERMAVFGEKVIGFAKLILSGPVTVSLISQLVRAATSVGTNYCEANDADSKSIFCSRSAYASARPRKPNIGCGWSWPLNRNCGKRQDFYGRRQRSSI